MPLDIHDTNLTPLLCLVFFFLSTFPSSGAAQRLWFHLLWGSQTNVIHAVEVTFDTIWAFQLVLMTGRFLLSEKPQVVWAITVFEDTSHQVAYAACFGTMLIPIVFTCTRPYSNQKDTVS